MNWDAISAVAEIIGAIAVVATLVYLAVQIRQNTKTAAASTRQAIADSATSPAKNFFVDADFRRAFNAHIDGKELDDDQFLYLQVYCNICFRTWENIHYQYRMGLLSDEEWAAFRRNLKAIFQVPVWQDNWRREGAVYTDAFRAEMDSIIAELNTGPKELPDSLIHGRSGATDAL